MKHMMEFTAEMIAGFLGGDIVGNKDAKVHTVSSIEEGRAGSLAYLTNPKYEPFLYTTGASIVLVDRAFEPSQPVAATLVKVDDAGPAARGSAAAHRSRNGRRSVRSATSAILRSSRRRPSSARVARSTPRSTWAAASGSATTPRSTPESKSTKAASWVRTASSTQGR